jgi:hypothetical protein
LASDDPSSIPQGERVTGVALLIARGLATIADGQAHLAPELVEGLHALAAPRGSLLLTFGAARSGEVAVEFFVTGSMLVAAYYSTNADAPLDRLDIISLANAAASVVEALAPREFQAAADASAKGTKASPVFEAEADMPARPVESVTQLNWRPPDGGERVIIVLLHDRGFTWVEGGESQKARLAYVETEEELARLVAGLIDVGVK